MRKAIIAAVVAFCLASCDNTPSWTVAGAITDAADSTLYLERMTLSGAETVDSVKLDVGGEFSFKDATHGAPEFYRLRIAQNIINIAADSTEQITVQASYPTMAADYKIDGSTECRRIQELTLRQMKLASEAAAIQSALPQREAVDSIMKLVRRHKIDVTTKYIYRDPKAASSYFALFQTIGGMLIFDPQADPDDIKTFAAVATAWDVYYEGSQRGLNLHNIAIEGLKTDRIIADRQRQTIPAEKISAAGIIDISLPDAKGRQQQLCQLKGKVVLLDFHVFAMHESAKRILLLRELYNKYHDRGLEIYQVSLDEDEHFWKQRTAALPWVCVFDSDGPQSKYIGTYNIQSLPEYFLIDRGSNLTARSSQIKDVEAEIEKLL